VRLEVVVDTLIMFKVPIALTFSVGLCMMVTRIASDSMGLDIVSDLFEAIFSYRIFHYFFDLLQLHQ